MVGEITIFLEEVYSELNKQFWNGELPPAVITVMSSPKTYGHYTPYDAWVDSEYNGYREINFSAEHLFRGPVAICATCLHEQTHYYCGLKGIREISREHHNRRFKEVAEAHGLIIEYVDARFGYTRTFPSQELIDFVTEKGWDNIELSRGIPAIMRGKDGAGDSGALKPKSHHRKYICKKCGISVRATKEVRIMCLDCGIVMEVDDKKI